MGKGISEEETLSYESRFSMSLGLFYFVYRYKKTYALRIKELLHKILKKMESHPKIDMKKRNTDVTKQTKTIWRVKTTFKNTKRSKYSV